MRHKKRRHKLGVSSQHRLAMLANLSVALITHGRIKTTLAKAKALRPFIEKVITLAKKAEASNEVERKLHFRRLAISRLNNPDAVAKLFSERVGEFMERPGGYTRIYKLGQRIGDAAEMALIELIDGNDEGYSKKPSGKTTRKTKEKTKKNSADSEAVAATVEEAVSVNDDEELSNKGSGVDSESSTNIPEVDEDESSSPEDEKNN